MKAGAVVRQPRTWRGIAVPAEFDRLFESFHQDFDRLYGSIDDALEEYVEGLGKPQREVVGAFLRSILNGRFNKAEVSTLWPTTDIKFVDPEKAVRPVFEALLDLLHKAKA